MGGYDQLSGAQGRGFNRGFDRVGCVSYGNPTKLIE